MYLKNIYLRSFRNYREQKVDFDARKTILVGDNAQGKSNLLEAVELLSTLKSHRSSRDRELVLEGETSGYIIANLERRYTCVELSLILRDRGSRTVALDKQTLRRHLDFLGTLNTVSFSSLDLELVRGGPEYRRHWIDNLLIQLEPVYLHILQQYERILKQRNALLKASEIKPIDTKELQLWDEQLATEGSRVTRRRARVLNRLSPIAQNIHANISGKTETLAIEYTPNINFINEDPESVRQAFLQQIAHRRLVEQHQGKTIVGPHRDEIEFSIDGTLARYYGSQGQQRTLVLALKLAELKLIEEVIGEPPLLLLDDVLAELDLKRQNQLLETIQDRFQTLITTTHIGSFDSQWLKSSQILSVDAGKIIFP
jgi:DNA replication and repair protein RecF